MISFPCREKKEEHLAIGVDKLLKMAVTLDLTQGMFGMKETFPDQAPTLPAGPSVVSTVGRDRLVDSLLHERAMPADDRLTSKLKGFAALREALFTLRAELELPER
jgi:hypothetical protein